MADPQMGTNLDGLADFSSQQPFCDLIKTARKFGTASVPYDGKGVVDSLGNPTGDFGVVVHTGVKHDLETYKVSYNGQAKMSGVSCPCSVANQNYDASKDLTTADVTVQKDGQLFLSFTATQNVKNISIISPKCAASSYLDAALKWLGIRENPTFTPDFLESVQFYSSIRFMDWLHTNSTPVSKWADRKTPQSLEQTGAAGVSWEYVVELSNLLKIDPWINVPALADDDYILQLAKFMKANLDPSLNLYVEYSNEVWNSIFAQYSQNLNAAQAEYNAGDVSLAGGAPLNQWHAAWRRTGKMAWKIASIFGQVYGEDQLNKKVRVVLAGQAAYSAPQRTSFLWINDNHPPVSKWIYADGIAPYFGCGNTKKALQPDGTTKDVPYAEGEVTTQMLIDGCHNSVSSYLANWGPTAQGWDGKSWTPNDFDLAAKYGIKVVAYESGQHLISRPIMGGAATNVAVRTAYEGSQEIGSEYDRYYRAWFAKGGDLAVHFVNISSWGDFFWGLQPDYKTETPKYLAVKKVALEMKMDPRDRQIAFLTAQVSSLKDQAAQSAAAVQACSEAKAKLQSTLDSIRAILK